MEIPLLEACPKPIKFYLPGPKTITFRCNEYFDPCPLSFSLLFELFHSRVVSLSLSLSRVPWITREIGRGPLIFAARVVSDTIMHVDRNYGFN